MPMRPESVKRRIVWINDEDWDTINAQAQAEGKNISVFIRERMLATNGHKVFGDGPLADAARFGKPRPAPKGK